MIIKEISTRHKDENGNPLYIIRNSQDYPSQYWPVMLAYLKQNAAAGLLKYEVLKK